MPSIPSAECSLAYRVYGDGTVETTLSYDPVKELGDMPEFGVMFKFDADYDNVAWYGMGPEETYVDRCLGAKLGIYKNKVADNMAEYLVPQECGNKVGVRWASVTDRKAGECSLQEIRWNSPHFPIRRMRLKTLCIPLSFRKYTTRLSGYLQNRWVLREMTAGVPKPIRNIF